MNQKKFDLCFSPNGENSDMSTSTLTERKLCEMTDDDSMMTENLKVELTIKKMKCAHRLKFFRILVLII